MVTYYNTLDVSPYSTQAGAVCELVANIATHCGYEGCKDEVVGCAVHSANIKTSKGYSDGASFLPVCARHKEWEFSKTNAENIAWNLGG